MLQRKSSASSPRLTPHWQDLALSQTLLKLTAPGVPDIYQGCELWDLRLVDPDNRAPVDYDVRRELLRVVSDDPMTASCRVSTKVFPNSG